MQYVDDERKPIKNCSCGADLCSDQSGVVVLVSDGQYNWDFRTVLNNGLLVDVNYFLVAYQFVNARCFTCDRLLDDVADVI